MSHAVLDCGNNGAEQADRPREVTEQSQSATPLERDGTPVAIPVAIEDRKQIESLRAAETRTLEMIANGANLSDVLNDLCAAIDKHASATSFVCLMDTERKQLLPIAGPGVPPAFARAITPWPIGPNRGSCGTAAFTKDRVIIPDVSVDPRWPDDARGVALNHGVYEAWSEPLISTGGPPLHFCGK